MGKGKKRSKEKKESDQPPSPDVVSPPSQPAMAEVATPSVVTEEEESVGLGLGGSSRSRKKKAKSTGSSTTPEPPQPMSVSTTPVHEPVHRKQDEPVKQEIQEESEGLGLGLPKGKSRPRKKKSSAPTPISSVPPATVSEPLSPVAGPSGRASPVVESSSFGARKKEPVAWGQSGPKIPDSGPLSSGSGRSDSQDSRQSGWGKTPKSGDIRRGSDAGSAHSSTSRESPSVESFAKLQIHSQEKIQPYMPSPWRIPLRIRSSPRDEMRMSRPLGVLVNYLPMRFKPQKMCRYDVSFQPDKPKQKLLIAYKMAKEKLFPKQIIAYDQVKNCYSLKPLTDASSDRISVMVEIAEENEKTLKIEVAFKYTGIVDLSTITQYMKEGTTLNPPTEAIQCVDVILKQGTLEGYVRSGRQYFTRPSRPRDLGDGLEMWTGLFQSAIFTSQPFVNIDVAHKGFPRRQSIIEAMTQDFRIELNRPLEQQRGRGVEAFLEYIKGLRVVAKLVGGPTIRTRDFMCNEMVKPPDQQIFTYTDFESNQQRKMSVAEYFRRIKGYNIKYPNMNCMWVGPRDRGIYFPVELLDVAYGQVRMKQLNERQLATMVREAATPPDIRKQKIEEVIKNMNYSRNNYFKHFGLEISEEFFRVQAKVLHPPVLEVGRPQGITPKNGVWMSNTLLKPEALESWGLICIELGPNESNSEYIVKLITDVGKQMGMRVAPPKVQKHNVRMEELRSLLMTAVEKGIKMLFIIITRRGRDIYARVKQMAECQVGILTQCIKEATASARMNGQTARNILLKVNSKLMGINQALDKVSTPPCLKGGDVMVIGADVTHPSPDQKNIPSIAAVTASIDPRCFRYSIELSVQTPKKEMIVQFEEMILDHLKVFKMHQGVLPKKLYIFRDGVSEGQFAQVMASELKALHRAYERLAGTDGPKPQVLFLLVQKRHHTRFFLPEGKTQYNVDPGTVVDTHIAHPHELDFYLVSHQAIKGTARPTRYHAVCNDGKIPDTEVEQLAYYLCHLYSRCMRAVSYPTPTYYAHLACLRARALTYGQTFINQDLERTPKRLRVLDKMLQHSRMFFV